MDSIFGALAQYGAGAASDYTKGQAEGLARSLPLHEKEMERDWLTEETKREQADAQALTQILSNPDPQARAQAIIAFQPTSKKFIGASPQMAQGARTEAERAKAFGVANQPVPFTEKYTTAAPGTTFAPATGAATQASMGPSMPPFRDTTAPPSDFLAPATRSGMRPPTTREFAASLFKNPATSDEAAKYMQAAEAGDVRGASALAVAQAKAEAVTKEAIQKREHDRAMEDLKASHKRQSALDLEAAQAKDKKELEAYKAEQSKIRLEMRLGEAERIAQRAHEDRQAVLAVRKSSEALRKVQMTASMAKMAQQQETAAFNALKATAQRLEAELMPGRGLMTMFGRPVPGAEAQVKEIQDELAATRKDMADWAKEMKGKLSETSFSPGTPGKPKILNIVPVP